MKSFHVVKFSAIFAMLCVLANFTTQQMHLGHLVTGLVLMSLWIASGKILFWQMNKTPEAARTFCVIVTMASVLFVITMCFHLTHWYLPVLGILFMIFWGYMACIYDHELRIS
jgi:hypothetical protein